MAQLVKYGSTEPIYFKVTLNGDGVAGLTFDANDIKYSLDNATAVNASTVGTIAAAAIGLGWYKWTPNGAANTQGKIIIFNIKDDSYTTTPAFDENGIIVLLGGNTSAYYDGV
jgi:hypothetical protein